MNLNEALMALSLWYGLPYQDLMRYAAEDEIGGYHADKAQEKWPCGSIWGVEGKILYALIRAMKPMRVLELGTYAGCSTSHIATALLRNGQGTLTTVGYETEYPTPAGYGIGIGLQGSNIVMQIEGDILEYLDGQLEDSRNGGFDFVFEDSRHDMMFVSEIYGRLNHISKPGALWVSHDAAHYLVGHSIEDGIQRAGYEPHILLTEPSDCGLSFVQFDRFDLTPMNEDPNEADTSKSDFMTEETHPLGIKEYDENEPEPEFDEAAYFDSDLDDMETPDYDSMLLWELKHQLEMMGLDVDDIEGTGANGRVLKEDIIKVLKGE